MYVQFLICMAIAIVVPIILTIFFEKKGLFAGKQVDLDVKFE